MVLNLHLVAAVQQKKILNQMNQAENMILELQQGNDVLRGRQEDIQTEEDKNHLDT